MQVTERIYFHLERKMSNSQVVTYNFMFTLFTSIEYLYVLDIIVGVLYKFKKMFFK